MTITLIGGPNVHMASSGARFIHVSYGRIIDEFARRFDRVYLCVGVAPARAAMHDYQLTDNVEVVPMPYSPTAASTLFKRKEIREAYSAAVSNGDLLFIRGVLTPEVAFLYSEAARAETPLIHWIPGNPMALLRSHRRGGLFKDVLAKGIVWAWERRLHRVHRTTPRAAYLCNGHEIARRHRSDQCHVTVSTTLVNDDFVVREDTCVDDPIRVLFLGFIRPEKGVEYLIEALPLLRTNRRTELVLAGSRERYPGYQERLDRLIAARGLTERVSWLGHVDYGDIRNLFREVDIFALPSLSEGTPRVLLEARAASVPVVSTNVGGIPTSVEHGHDGLLVPPKDPQALAGAIDRVIENGPLRRALITNGFKTASNNTVDQFVDQVLEIGSGLFRKGRATADSSGSSVEFASGPQVGE